MAVVKLGTIIETDGGIGPIVAITRNLIVHELEDGTDWVVEIEGGEWWRVHVPDEDIERGSLRTEAECSD